MIRESFQPRQYQAALSTQAVREDLLCVLPTGLGKTAIAAALRLFERAYQKGGG